MKNLQSFQQIVGIDLNEQAIRKAQGKIGQDNIQFLVMNAERLVFKNKIFDTESISASFHHLANIRQVLDEMERVLKPGGNFIIAEMHRDCQTEAELTSVYFHHWVAEVDTALGCLHNQTLRRQELMDHTVSLGLSEVKFYDFIDRDSNPMERKLIEQLDDLATRITERAKSATSYRKLKRRGDELRQRLHTVGAQREPILVAIGKK
jgi:ubiquinone/menaquinone biosynthesis C-methylase UbiE